MIVRIKGYKEVNVTHLEVIAVVRYWKDADWNGVTDTEDGQLAHFKFHTRWIITIDVETGKILNWKEGTTADIHYKTCDDICCYLLDKDGNEVARIVNHHSYA